MAVRLPAGNGRIHSPPSHLWRGAPASIWLHLQCPQEHVGHRPSRGARRLGQLGPASVGACPVSPIFAKSSGALGIAGIELPLSSALFFGYDRIAKSLHMPPCRQLLRKACRFLDSEVQDTRRCPSARVASDLLRLGRGAWQLRGAWTRPSSRDQIAGRSPALTGATR